MEQDPNAGPQPLAPPVTLEGVIRAAQHMQRHGDFQRAEAVYLRILEQLPLEPNALHFLGVLRHQQGDAEAAVALIQQAIEQIPADPGPWINLGNVLLDAGRFDPATDAYKRAAELAPDNVLVYNNLGLLHTRRGNPEVADAAFQHALALAPDAEYVVHNYTRLLHGRGQYERALAYSLMAVGRFPANGKARRLLSISHALLGDMAAAQQALQDWLAVEPGHPEALHLLAGCGGMDAPARAADAYVVHEFDGFAGSFDAKLEALNYQAPRLVGEALRQALGPACALLDEVLDAGCGTGLCAATLRPLARRLSGVDLSPGMLDRARTRGGYDQLVCAELTAHIREHTGAWNAIVSADTLCYFGDLSEVAQAAAGALRPGGLLVFSVEAIADAAVQCQPASGYTLRYNGRYQHTQAYIKTCLAAAGLSLFSLTQQVLRQELMRPVDGWIVVARRDTAPNALA